MRPSYDRAVLFRLAGLALVLLALAGCRAVQRPVVTDLDTRRLDLLELEHWRIQGRVAISDGREGGSGRLDWSQQGEQYTLEFRAPISGRSWRLSGGPGGAMLEGLRPQPSIDSDVGRLLERELDWPVPVESLRLWVLGLVDPGSPAGVDAGEGGLPRRIRQRGWSIEYQDWIEIDGRVLPRRLVAEVPGFRLRLIVDGWQLGPARSSAGG